MPNRRRNRPTHVVGLLWILSMFVAATFAASLGSGTARADNHDPSAAASQAEETQPEETQPEETEEPPTTECSSPDSAGPLPSGTQSIGGTVTDSLGQPLADIQVRFSLTGPAAATIHTNAEGQFLLGSLGNGTYLVSFFDATVTYQSGFYDAGPLALTPGSATAVALTGSGATGIDATLPAEQLHSVAGTVTDYLGAPLADASVRVDGVYFPLVGCGTSDAAGEYVAPGVRVGVYRVSVSRPGFPNGYYREDVPSGFTTHHAEATLLTVDSDLTGIDLAFPELFSLSGIVLDAADNPIEGFYVGASETLDGANAAGSSDSVGQFTIEGLPAGEYVIEYFDMYQRFLSGWYAGDGIISPTRTGALAVNVPGPAIELFADPAPTVSGIIRNGGGQPLEYVQVNLCDEEAWNCFSGTTDSAGSYVASIVQPGTYTAQVWDNTTTYPSGGYIQADGSIALGIGTALEIPVSASSVTGVDGTLPDGGRVTATLTSGGAAVPYPYVLFCQSENACSDSNPTSDEFGNATSPVLFEGTVYVRDGSTDYWLVDGGTASTSFFFATPVVVSAGVTSTITSDVPSPGSGTTTDAGGDGEQAEIQLDDGSGTSPVTLTFPDITESGTTSLTTTQTGSSTPDGFQLGLPATYYDISTTAGYVPPVTICISYAGVSYADETTLRFYHYDSTIPGWDDITVSVDTVNDEICGETNSLSPFVIVEPLVYSFAGFIGPKSPPKVNDAKAGATIALKFSLGGDVGLDFFVDGTPTTRQIDCTTGAPMGTETTATGTLKYSTRTGNYTYAWMTLKAWKSTCREVTLSFDDGTVASLWYRLKA